MMLRTLLIASCAASSLSAACYSAEPYPVKPVRLIVVNPAGSGADIIARTVGQKFSETFSQQFVVDNRGGASGITATELVARASPDGYTLLMGSSSSQTINAAVYTKLPYDPVKDLRPITMLASTPYLMVAHTSLPAKNVGEVIALAKAKPGALNYAAGGVAVGSTLAGELFKVTAGVNIVMVPYKGAPQATSDVVAGQVQLAFSTLPTGLPLVRAGRLKALAVTSADRVPVAPDIPSMAESGLPGYDVKTWFGMLAPRGTDTAIINRLHREAGRALEQPDVKQRLLVQGFVSHGTTPEEFSRLITEEIERWSSVVKAAGIQRLSLHQAQ